MPSRWLARNRQLPLERPFVLGILNTTPDSFSDGGRFLLPNDALAQAERMVAEGADGIDVGGESTRPQGARPVSEDDERSRVLPVIGALRRRFPDLLLSVDTVKSGVARAALDEGADVVNDVSAFRLDPAMAETCARAGAGVILMHSRGTVSEMGTFVHANYGDDPVAEVIGELRASVDRAEQAGVERNRIVLDPGIGFAKRGEQSLQMLGRLAELVACDFPVMVGVSRKRFIGEINGVSDPAARVHGTVGANVAALERGARLFRVHDVAPNRQALDVAWAVMRSGPRP